VTSRPKQVHLAVHFPGVNATTVWSDPTSGSQIAFSSFVHLAKTAERGLFDFFFLAEGLRLREHRGRIFDLDVVGRPDSLTVLAALARVTTKVGLAATLNTTFNEPYELARQFATLDHLSHGRAAWNAVTSPDSFTGENFRRGGFLDHGERYERAGEFIEVTRAWWDRANANDGQALVHRGKHFDVTGHFDVPASPQGWPVQIQAGDSDGGREMAARLADVIFSRFGGLQAGQTFFNDVKSRLATYGRSPGELLIFPAATVVLGDTTKEASERNNHLRRQQISPQGAIAALERVWGCDLSGWDPDGPLPDFDPDVEGVTTISKGRVQPGQDPVATARQWRELSEANRWSIRDTVVEMTTRSSFVGTPSEVARQIDENIQSDAADGYILVPNLTPHGLDEFVDRVIPILQERGSYREEYEGPTLRENLGLPVRVGVAS
jgi:FMN-dependent oxidoreductase (nitrilotriacetate monooxygenase family)